MELCESNFIPFNRPFIVGKELFYIAQAVLGGHLAGDGRFTRLCNRWLEEKFGARKILLTTSCTAALEMAAILCDLQEGDEVILPSYTFVSTANAFVLRGARLKFVDIRPDNLNINEELIAAALTPRTRIIAPVHYAGVGCAMDRIMALARDHGVFVVEDAAHGILAQFQGRYLGTLGDIGCFSFHETKNFICGEGGAISLNNDRFIERAEIIREKGTNRSKFFRGEVDKYTWVDIGSSYLPSEILAAFLYAQLEEAETINRKRRQIYDYYYHRLTPLRERGLLRLPALPPDCEHNAHMFYIITADAETRDNLLPYLNQRGVNAVFHYVPLHASPMGRRFGCQEGDLPVTEDLSARLARLPFFYELDEPSQDRVVREIEAFYGV